VQENYGDSAFEPRKIDVLHETLGGYHSVVDAL
jgi:hypothetical protein